MDFGGATADFEPFDNAGCRRGSARLGGGEAVSWPAVAAALIGSMLIQTGTNLHNDAADLSAAAMGRIVLGRRGRPHPACWTASPSVAPHVPVSRSRHSWVPISFGSAAGRFFCSAFCRSYRAGPIPGAPFPSLTHRWANCSWWRFLGWAPYAARIGFAPRVLGPAAVEAGLAVGLLTAAVLLVNNHRDAKADARVGRRTLAIIAGPMATSWIYAALLLAPFALLFPIGQALPRGQAWPALVALPLAGLLINRFAHEPGGRGFNRILVQTVQIQLLFCLLLSLGLVL